MSSDLSTNATTGRPAGPPEVHVLTDPVGADYTSHRVHAPGEHVVLPDSIGAEVKLDVSAVLRAGEPKKDT
ncbi:hypothetical protein ACFWSJ_00830 [Streptomyces niveus]|uniref:hypothetical protein n=1 Tax=Streptomyces niveus TaxID=193462 RepID=UPI00364FBAF2